MAVSVPDIRGWPEDAPPITAITAYDRPTALSADRAGVEIVLVGDSAAQVIHGREHTTEVGMAEILFHLRAVRPHVQEALLLADLPFGPAQVGDPQAAEAAVALVAAGAQGVKVEGGERSLGIVERLTAHGVAVMGHLGLTPQSVHTLGGYKVRGRDPEGAEAILGDALALEKAGAFAIVLECVPAPLATLATERLSIPTIGIGSGGGCRGQILVFHDAVGWEGGTFRFLPRPFGEVGKAVDDALARYCQDVREGKYPGEGMSWDLPPGILEDL